MVKPETTLTFYGGVSEVGGNKVLLKDRDTSIFLDFGMSYSIRSKYYSDPFLAPRSEKSLIELGILPKIDGIYKSSKKTSVNAVFISHSHFDHSAYISFIKSSIPVYTGETTEIILEAISATRPKDLEFNLKDVSFATFRTGHKIKIGSIEIEPIHVDHSVPGAYGFIVHTSSGTIAYTGDFRMHGAKYRMSMEFVKKAAEAEPVALITEATNLTGAHYSSENEVKRKLTKIIAESSGLVLADFARADVDRFRSFYNAAKKNGRILAISLKQAYLLKELAKDRRLKIPHLDDENIAVFRKKKSRYYGWEKEIQEEYEEKVVNAEAVGRNGDKYVLVLSFYDFEELIDVRPPPGSCYILSASEPFNEEMEIDFERLKNWLEHYGLPQYHVHVSGHIMPLQLKKAIEDINPKMVFPVHTEHPELFKKFVGNLQSKIVIPERERKYILR